MSFRPNIQNSHFCFYVHNHSEQKANIWIYVFLQAWIKSLSTFISGAIGSNLQKKIFFPGIWQAASTVCLWKEGFRAQDCFGDKVDGIASSSRVVLSGFWLIMLCLCSLNLRRKPSLIESFIIFPRVIKKNLGGVLFAGFPAFRQMTASFKQLIQGFSSTSVLKGSWVAFVLLFWDRSTSELRHCPLSARRWGQWIVGNSPSASCN